MPVNFVARLTHPERTRTTNRQLGGVLAFVAGAVNAGGFLAVGQYTSHMTGAISSIADELVIGQLAVVGAACGVIVSFILGAMTTAIMINWGRRRKLHSQYALPLLAEAAFLLLFGVMGASIQLAHGFFVPATVLLLSFVMGLQNAIITKASQAEVRTTHMTGIVTDIGIELGRLLYRNRAEGQLDIDMPEIDRDKLLIHTAILGLFLIGGICGAFAFRRFGFQATVPLAVLLALMATPALLRDVTSRSLDRY